MDRAEQMGFKRYRDNPYYGGHMKQRVDDRRFGYIEGYRRAEHELTLTWQDVATLIAIYEQEVEVGNISRYEGDGAPSLQDASEIILKRFIEIRKK